MMINVKNRSPESWGPLASMTEGRFNQILNNRRGKTKEMIKNETKRVKKLKTYKITFHKKWSSEQFEVQAVSSWDASAAASEFFKENDDKIEFKETPRSKWADRYAGYDSISCVEVK